MRIPVAVAIALCWCRVMAVDFEPARVRAAGCYVAVPQGVLVVVGRLRDKLQLPAGGRQAGESAACTARRETLEETGIAVRVGEALAVRDRGRFVLFRCTPLQPLPAPGALAPLNLLEISEVLVINPRTLRDRAGVRRAQPWRFPADHALLRRLFARSGQAAQPLATDRCRTPATGTEVPQRGK